jgi:hypothetical protein
VSYLDIASGGVDKEGSRVSLCIFPGRNGPALSIRIIVGNDNHPIEGILKGDQEGETVRALAVDLD